MTFSAPDVRWPESGLVAGVVQDAADGRVLMVGWLDREALDVTMATALVHFHSRSRDRLWRKGETSGNELRVVSLAADCDGDALLLTVEPTGPTCHTGTRSCFDAEAPGSDTDAPIGDAQGFAWLETLWSTIQSRAQARPAGSYTSSLLDGGVDAVARKVAEEALEVALAAKDHAADPSADRRDALAGESADLLFHLLALLAERRLEPREALAALRERRTGPPSGWETSEAG
jgi:phosphoribosyl-ATP pyrophosphohydrolase/phosphoribosyl-AMP cyclohydrolase